MNAIMTHKSKTTLKSNKTYQVKLIQPSGEEINIQVREDEYITDAAINQGINLPCSCNEDICVTCSARLLMGSVLPDHNFLTPLEEEAGFLLTCKTYVKSDSVILTNQEDELLDL